MSPSPTALADPTVAHNSADIFATADPSSPFVKELAQINEVAEEFGLVREQDLISRGLRKFGVEDYLEEIRAVEVFSKTSSVLGIDLSSFNGHVWPRFRVSYL
jgi:hypothetical protein